MSGREFPARPLVGLAVAVVRPGAALLIRRGRPPGEGEWSLPGGAQRLGETAEAGARRELQEETGLLVDGLRLVAHADSIHRDPDGRVRYHYTILDFAAAWVAGEPVADGDALEARFVPFEDFGHYALRDDLLQVLTLARAAFSCGDGGSAMSG